MIHKILISAVCLILVLVCVVYGTTFIESSDNTLFVAKIMNDPIDSTIIKRCKKDHNYTDEDMFILEREFKRYMAISQNDKQGKRGFGMYSKDVDNLWHTYILFTKDYAAFCERNFGRFIHHIPEITLETPSSAYAAESASAFRDFIITYEKTFNENIHAIWLLDLYEGISHAS